MAPVDQQFDGNGGAFQILHHLNGNFRTVWEFGDQRRGLDMDLFQSLLLPVSRQFPQRSQHILIAFFPFCRIPGFIITHPAYRCSHHRAAHFNRQVNGSLEKRPCRQSLLLRRRKQMCVRVRSQASECAVDHYSCIRKGFSVLTGHHIPVLLRPPGINKIPGELNMVNLKVILDHLRKLDRIQPAFYCKR